MSTRLHEVLAGTFGTLPHKPTAKRIRATLGATTVVGSTNAILLCVNRDRSCLRTQCRPTVSTPTSHPRHRQAARTPVPAATSRMSRTSRPRPSVPFVQHTVTRGPGRAR